MEPSESVLRRYGLALLLLVATALVLGAWTMPALRDRAALHRRDAALKAEASTLLREADRYRDWKEHGRDDPVMRGRIEQQHRISPEVVGPVIDRGADADGAGQPK